MYLLLLFTTPPPVYITVIFLPCCYFPPPYYQSSKRLMTEWCGGRSISGAVVSGHMLCCPRAFRLHASRKRFSAWVYPSVYPRISTSFLAAHIAFTLVHSLKFILSFTLPSALVVSGAFMGVSVIPTMHFLYLSESCFDHFSRHRHFLLLCIF